jgi:hypothetical protein
MVSHRRWLGFSRGNRSLATIVCYAYQYDVGPILVLRLALVQNVTHHSVFTPKSGLNVHGGLLFRVLYVTLVLEGTSAHLSPHCFLRERRPQITPSAHWRTLGFTGFIVDLFVVQISNR